MNVRKADECWDWGLSAFKQTGYGQFAFAPGNIRTAHRVAYELTYDSVDPSLVVMHSCDNRKCVNPGHLSLGTFKDNTADMMAKGRGNYSNAVRGDNHPARRNPSRLARGERTGTSKLTDIEVLEIRTVGRSVTAGELAKRYRVSDKTIRRILNGYSWTHLGSSMGSAKKDEVLAALRK